MKDFYNTHSKYKPLPKKKQTAFRKSKDTGVISGKRHHEILETINITNINLTQWSYLPQFTFQN